MTLLDRVLGDIAVPSLPGVVEWAERNIEFPSRVSPNEPGLFRVARRPYMREPLEAWRDPSVTDLVLCWGAQCAKTTLLTIGMAYRLDQDPLPCVWVMPTEALGRSWSSTRWQPLIDANEVLRRHKPEDSDHFKLTEMHFDSLTMNIVGSNSPANLASRPAGIVVQDECCKFAGATKDEASAMKLADQRTKTFPRAFRAKASTPTVPEHEFWQEFLASDQRYFHLECPHCREMIIFEHTRRTLRWDENAKGDDGRWDRKRVRETARYHCPHCDGPIDDRMKMDMLAGPNEWRSTNPNADRGRRGYHLNSFYSPDVTFGTMAVKFLEAADLFGLQDYNNGWLAIPYEQKVFSVKEADVLAARLPGFRKTRIPLALADIAYIILTVDPGDNQTHWVISAITPTGDTYVVEWGTALSIEDIDLVMANTTITDAAGETVRPEFGLIDSGDRAMRVYDYCATTRGFFHPTKGQDTTFGTWAQTAPKSHPGLTLYTYSDFQAKMELYEQRVKKRMPPLLYIPEDSGPELIDGLSGQSLVEKNTPRGRVKMFKKLPGDHFGDCIKLAQISWWVLRGEYEQPAEPPPPAENPA